MSSAIDSKAAFVQRVKSIGLADYLEKFEQHGFSTLADFAFCGNYTPGAPDDAKFLIEAKKILGVELP